jgi:preprotein translocase subunit SecG
MSSVLLVIHMFLALAIIGLVMLQRSEGGGLGIGGSGGLGGLATPQGTANILSRATAICAAGFFVTSLALGAIAGHNHVSGSILDKLDTPVAGTAAPGASIVTEAPTAVPEAEGEEKAVNDNKDVKKDTSKTTTKDITKDTGPKTPSAPISE